MSVGITLRAIAGSFMNRDTFHTIPSESWQTLTSSILADGFWRAQIVSEHTILGVWRAHVSVANVSGVTFARSRRVVAFRVVGAERWEGDAVGGALL